MPARGLTRRARAVVQRQGMLRPGPSLIAALALLLSGATAARAEVVVDGAACGLATGLPRALAKRGVLAPGLSVRVTIGDDRITIVLSEAGAAPVERVVRRSPSCAADLDLVVLIVERQRRELTLGAEDLDLPPAPVRSATITAPEPELALERHLELGLRGGPEIGGRIRGELELVGRFELGRFGELLAGARLMFPASVPVTGRGGAPGAIEAWAVGGWAGAGVGLVTGDARLFLAAQGGLEHTRAGASEALFQRETGGAWDAVLGFEGRYERAVWDDALWLSFGLAGRFRPGAPSFVVEGADSTFVVPSATLVARVAVWVRFF